MARRISDPKDTVAFVFSKKGCRYCTAAEELLKRNGFIVHMLDHRIPKYEILLDKHLPPEKSRKNITYPQIFIGDSYIDGYSELSQIMK